MAHLIPAGKSPHVESDRCNVLKDDNLRFAYLEGGEFSNSGTTILKWSDDSIGYFVLGDKYYERKEKGKVATFTQLSDQELKTLAKREEEFERENPIFSFFDFPKPKPKPKISERKRPMEKKEVSMKERKWSWLPTHIDRKCLVAVGEVVVSQEGSMTKQMGGSQFRFDASVITNPTSKKMTLKGTLFNFKDNIFYKIDLMEPLTNCTYTFFSNGMIYKN
jgi:hypothetical protein